jgi:hypothetical protein
MLMPCSETYKRMLGAQAGVWPESVNDGSIELAVKLSADLTKAVLKGAPVTLVTALIHASCETVRVVGLRIEDDKNDPAIIHQPQVKAEEQKLFDALLEKEGTWITFFDELVRPVMAGRVVWDAEHAKIALVNLNRTAPHYQGSNRSILIEAMDSAVKSISKRQRNDGPSDAQTWKAIPLRFEDLRPINVSSPEAGTFTVDDPDEGGGLEKSAFLFLEATYPGTAHLNPQFDHGPGKREFCDVLVVGDTDLFIIQSKVMAMLDRNPSQLTERRVARVFSSFQAAMRQLGGSVRMFRLNKTIFTKHSVKIPIDFGAIKMVHGIVLLSTTHLSLSWPKVRQELTAASHKADARFHLLELAELQQHVAFGKTLSEMSQHLSRRFEVVEKSGNANVGARFLDEENRPLISKPIDDDEMGYVFTLEVERYHKVDKGRVLRILSAALKVRRFTGRCEYFQDVGVLEGEKFCWIALGLQWEQEEGRVLSYDWWIALREEVRPHLEEDSQLRLSQLSEMARLGEIRSGHSLALIIEFVGGKAVGFYDPDIPRPTGE